MRKLIVAGLMTLILSGCAIVSVVDSAVSTAATAVKIGAKTVGTAVDVVIPDGDDKDDKKDEAKKEEK